MNQYLITENQLQLIMNSLGKVIAEISFMPLLELNKVLEKGNYSPTVPAEDDKK